MSNKRKLIARFLAIIIVFIMALSTFLGCISIKSNAATQTTIIYFDTENRHFSIGETLTVKVGISSPNGGYLKSANCGFGYNASTMKLLTKTESVDHYYVESDTPVKTLYFELKFEMITNGKMYFIAGAYSGNGVIEAIKSDGSRIECPRASVVYEIGTGIYSKVSDCNLASLNIYNDETGQQITMNRDFDKNITEYWVDGDVNLWKLRIDAAAEKSDDSVIIPDNLSLVPGKNDIVVSVEAVDSTKKDYIIHITKPEISVNVEDISVSDEFGNSYNIIFNPEVFRYDLSVPNNVKNISFNVKTDNAYNYSIEEVNNKELELGYNTRKVKVVYKDVSKIYEFYVFRELPDLSLSSLVVELSDSNVLKMYPEFSPDVFEYKGHATADIQKAIVSCEIPENENVTVSGDGVYELRAGNNEIRVSVSDGTNAQDYVVNIDKDQGTIAYAEDPDNKPKINNKKFTDIVVSNPIPFLIAGVVILVILLAVLIVFYVHAQKNYLESEEYKTNVENKSREKRVREKEKEMEEKIRKRKEKEKEKMRL